MRAGDRIPHIDAKAIRSVSCEYLGQGKQQLTLRVLTDGTQKDFTVPIVAFVPLAARARDYSPSACVCVSSAVRLMNDCG